MCRLCVVIFRLVDVRVGVDVAMPALQAPLEVLVAPADQTAGRGSWTLSLLYSSTIRVTRPPMWWKLQVTWTAIPTSPLNVLSSVSEQFSLTASRTLGWCCWTSPVSLMTLGTCEREVRNI